MITQIYEIQNAVLVEPLCEIGVDHIGSVVLTEDAWKQPELLETIRTVQAAGKTSSLIPLFSQPETLYRCLDYYRPDIVHFCEMLVANKMGFQTCRRMVDLQGDIRTRYPDIALMRSIPIGQTAKTDTAATLQLAAMFQPVSDYFLTDTVLSDNQGATDQPVAGFVGITGQTCDWETARELVTQSAIPVILAGGLSPENVYRGILSVHPAGVDSCTQTNRLNETGNPIRFEKDMARVRLFVEETRRAKAALKGQ